MKKCSKCNQIQELSEYYKQPSCKDGLFSHCKTCEKTKTKERYKANPKAHKDRCKKWVNENREHVNLQRHAWRVGLTKENLQKILATRTQCEICGAKQNLVTDHDHKTKTFRGVLCSKCNTGIGKLGDNYKQVLKAAEYLRNHEILL